MKVSQAIRYALQAARENETDRSLARKFNLDPRTVARWRSRSHILDLGRAPHRQGRRKLEPVEVALLCSARLATGWPLDRLRAVLGGGFSRPVSRQQIAAILAARGLLRPPRPRLVPPAAYLTYFLIADADDSRLLVESRFFPASGTLAFHSRRVGQKEALPLSLSEAARRAVLRSGERVHASHGSMRADLPGAAALRYRRPWWWRALRRGGSGAEALPLFDLSIPGTVLRPEVFSRSIPFAANLFKTSL